MRILDRLAHSAQGRYRIISQLDEMVISLRLCEIARRVCHESQPPPLPARRSHREPIVTGAPITYLTNGVRACWRALQQFRFRSQRLTAHLQVSQGTGCGEFVAMQRSLNAALASPSTNLNAAQLAGDGAAHPIERPVKICCTEIQKTNELRAHAARCLHLCQCRQDDWPKGRPLANSHAATASGHQSSFGFGGESLA